MPISAKDFNEGMQAWKEARLKSGLRGGPAYTGDNGGRPLVWFDQVFERQMEPVGTVNCSHALRVGSTQNGLDVILVASHANEDALKIPAGSTITVSLLQSDAEDGTYEDVGPTICVKAPLSGLEVMPDDLVARFSIGNMTKPWLMISVEFSGAITGGTIDAGLGYVAR